LVRTKIKTAFECHLDCALQFKTMQSILTLDLPFKPLLADVRTGSNGGALHAANAWVGELASDAPERFVLCWGSQGVGKTLLSHALTHSSPALRLSPALNLSPADDVSAFEAALSADAVVLDDVHALNAEQAVAAFNLYNHIRATPHKRWWATSRVPPSHMTSVLPDLASRMAWGLVFELLPLSDTDSIHVLQAQAVRLGFELSSETAQYLLLRLERNLGALARHMGSLNHYALTLKKPVTNHLVQQWYATRYLPSLQRSMI
jgi:DnaA family protein